MIPTENLRFRDESLTFRISETVDDVLVAKTQSYSYPNMVKTLGGFKLHVDAGQFADSEIIVLLGENGMGKTTLVQMLGGKLAPDEEDQKISLRVSMKPQTSESDSVDLADRLVSPKFPGTVRMLLLKRIKAMFMREYTPDDTA
jgi:ATP-binding cassette subfamily E protein 1